MKSWIELDEMEFFAYHGVLDQEAAVGNRFRVWLKVEGNLQSAIDTDELEDTVSYADIYQVVRHEMTIRAKLLEHLAGRIVYQLYRAFPTLERIEIKLAKVNPPGCGEIKMASICLQTDRCDVPNY